MRAALYFLSISSFFSRDLLRTFIDKRMDIWIQNSSVVSRRACVCSDQPIATAIGVDILKKGGNAADAAIATMAAVTVIQPLTCGLGGDCHCLFYRQSDKAVLSINGSGRTGKEATLEKVKAAGITDSLARECSSRGLWVSVPGAVAGMSDIIEHFGSGKITLKEILEPAIKLAEEGVPIPHKQATMWKQYKNIFMNSRNAGDLLNDGQAPEPGDIIFAPKLGKIFREIAASGPRAFYFGNTARNIVEEVQLEGGVLTLEDMQDHILNPPSVGPSDAVSIDFHGYRVWEMKPNTMGIVALVALNVLKTYNLKVLGHNTAEYIHILSEAIKQAYLECWEYLCDPDYCTKQLEVVLKEETANRIRNKIDTRRSSQSNLNFSAGDTSYVAAVDEEGNGCSFICSVFDSFGTGIIPEDCGFVMHNRAQSMSLDETASNVFGPRKLPLHSILPVIVTDNSTRELLAVMGLVGRWMQPQGHVQLLLNMTVFGMDPQVALNQPRFFVGDPRPFIQYRSSLDLVCLEGGIDNNVIPYLKTKGYECKIYDGFKREVFGKGHVIARSTIFNRNSASMGQTWWAGADPRSDGCAIGV